MTAREDELLTVDEVIDELKVKRRTFYEWRKKGTGPPCYKLPNNELRIYRTDFDEWFARRLEKGAA